jgi:type IX secretion system PorP/SprF family membrane protein
MEGIKTKIICFIVGCCFILPVAAQQDEQLTFYNYNPLYYNPAYAGSRDALSAVAIGRFQWVQWKGAPNTQFFSLHSPVVGQLLGMGLNVVNDQIGSRKRTSAYYSVSSGIRLNKKNARLAVGLTAGMDAMTFDFSNLAAADVNDPFYGQHFSTTKFNIGAGLYYYSDRHYVGVSSPRLLEPKAADAQDVLRSLTKRHFFIMAGTVFDLNSVVKFKPTTLIKITPDSPMTFDVNMNFLFYDKVWLGALYRFHEAVGLNFVVQIRDFMHIGYGYDFPINKLVTYQRGSHEVLVQFDMRSKKSVYTSPRYF